MIARHVGRFRSAVLVCAAVFLPVGCSGSSDGLPREPISGTVTFDGQTLANGSISFIPSGGPAGQGDATPGGGTITNGKFSIDRESGLVPGTYNVAIYASERSARTRPAQVGAAPKASELPKELIPAKFNANTELKTEITKGGGNVLTFTLQTK
jgi:hypothetical protein